VTGRLRGQSVGVLALCQGRERTWKSAAGDVIETSLWKTDSEKKDLEQCRLAAGKDKWYPGGKCRKRSADFGRKFGRKWASGGDKFPTNIGRKMQQKERGKELGFPSAGFEMIRGNFNLSVRERKRDQQRWTDTVLDTPK